MNPIRLRAFTGTLLLTLLYLTPMYSFCQSTDNVSKNNFNKARIEYRNYEKTHGYYVQTDNVLMHYLTWGNPKDMPLIWAHGSLMSAYELEPLAKQLTSAGYYLIAIDYYGHGKTPVPQKEVSLYNIADDIAVLMDSLKIRQAVIGGFSRGGYIASAFYQSYPRRVKGLILEDGGSVTFNSFYHKMNDADLNAKAKTMDIPDTVDKLYNATYSSEFEAYKSLYDAQTGGDQFDLLNLIKHKGDAWFTYQGMMKYFAMSNATEFKELVLRPDLLPLYGSSIAYIQPKIIFRNLDVPVLLLDPVSANDPMPFEAENIALANAHPRLIIRKEYKGVEHNIHYADPKQFCKDLADFLNRVRNL